MNINDVALSQTTETSSPPATLVNLGSDSSGASTASTSSHINYEHNSLNDEEDYDEYEEGEYIEYPYSHTSAANIKQIDRDSFLRRNIKTLNSTARNNMVRRLSNANSDVASVTNGSLFGGFSNEETSSNHLQFNSNSTKGCCNECGSYTIVVRCASHCDKQVCEACQEKHWQMEINELLSMKTYMENCVADLKKYLAAKRSQCLENVKGSLQIKKFINMTMQQIKRKVELELESKRDELFAAVDNFCEDQKNQDVNVIKIKSLKAFAKSQTQKLNLQKSSKMPLYSIFFVPDSNLEIKNSFGRVVLKSHQVGSSNPSDKEELSPLGDKNSDFSFINNVKHDVSPILRSNTQRYNLENFQSRRSSIQNPKRTSSMYTPVRNSYQPTPTNTNIKIGETNNLMSNNEQTERKEVVKTKSFIPGKELLEQSNNNQQTSQNITSNNQDQAKKPSQQLNSSFDKSRLKRIDFLKSLSQEKEKF